MTAKKPSGEREGKKPAKDAEPAPEPSRLRRWVDRAVEKVFGPPPEPKKKKPW